MDVYRHVSSCWFTLFIVLIIPCTGSCSQANVPEQLQDEQRFTEKVAVIDCGRRQTIAATCELSVSLRPAPPVSFHLPL